MTKHRILATLVLTPALALAAAVALADDPPKNDAAGPPAVSPPRAQLDSHANAMAAAMVDAHTDFETLREKIAERSAKVPEKTRLDAENRLKDAVDDIDDDAGAKGDARVAARLADEFGMTADALAAEKAALGISWGELTIAHTIAANSATAVTVEQLWQMKQNGMGWGRIAAGLDLKLGSVVSAVRAESAVARGLTRADGKVAAMQGGGAKGIGAGAKLDAGVGHGKSGVGASAGLGVKAGGRLKP